MRWVFMLAVLLLSACSGSMEPTGPAEVGAVETMAPSFVRVARPGSYVTPLGITCTQLAMLGTAGPYNGNNAYYQSLYNLYCFYDDGTVAPPTTPPPPPPPPPANPPCQMTTRGCTKTAGNN